MSNNGGGQSEGARYYPEAFEKEIVEAAEKVVADSAFLQLFNRFILAVVADPAQLVHFRVPIIQEIARLAPAHLTRVNQVTWCSLSLATEKYFDETARIFSWSANETAKIKSKWYEFTSMAFVPKTSNTRLNTSLIKEWSAEFLALHKFNKGVPLSQREQVILAIVQQALVGAPWQKLNAETMSRLNITEEEVEAEIKKRKESGGESTK